MPKKLLRNQQKLLKEIDNNMAHLKLCNLQFILKHLVVSQKQIYSNLCRRERLHCNSVNTENRDVVLSACKNSNRLLNYHMQSDVL